MSAPPIPCMFDGDAFRPVTNFARVARQHYGAGEVVSLVTHEERSMKSHDHFFAVVAEAWKTLPEDLAEQFPTSEHLRKHALIRTGHHNSSSTVCMFKTEALRLVAAMAPLDEFSLVVVSGKVVTRYVAKSQSLKAMGKEAFQQSKDDVLGFLADLIGVTQTQLTQARAA